MCWNPPGSLKHRQLTEGVVFRQFSVIFVPRREISTKNVLRYGASGIVTERPKVDNDEVLRYRDNAKQFKACMILIMDMVC